MKPIDSEVLIFGKDWAASQITSKEESIKLQRKGRNDALKGLTCLFTSCAALSISIFKIDAEHQALRSSFVEARAKALMPEARLKYALALQAANITPVADIARQMVTEPDTIDLGKTVTPDYVVIEVSAEMTARKEHATKHNWYAAGKYGTAGVSALAALWAAALVYGTRQQVKQNQQEIAEYRAHLDDGPAPTQA